MATAESVLNTKLGELVKDQSLICLSTEDTVESALETLARHNISAAPVVAYGQEKRVLGFVDVLDLVAYMCTVATRLLVKSTTGESRHLATDDFDMLRKRSKEFKLAVVVDVIDFSGRDHYYHLKSDVTVQDAIDLYLKGAHRIAVTSDDNPNNIIGILSQSLVLQRLSSVDDRNSLPLTLLETTVESAVHKSTKVISVHPGDLAIDSFLMMHKNNLSSVAVASHEGQLMTNLSASDLKGLATKDLEALRYTTLDYLELARTAKGRHKEFLVAVKPNATLFEAILLAVRQKTHRLYVVDNDMKPLGVLSMTDMLRALSPARSMRST